MQDLFVIHKVKQPKACKFEEILKIANFHTKVDFNELSGMDELKPMIYFHTIFLKNNYVCIATF